MKVLSLNGSDWKLTGFWPEVWRLRKKGQDPATFRPAVPPLPAIVPGEIHADLLRAGIIADWNVGLNSAACEWVNNRDWALAKRFTVPNDFDGQLTLECDGLDYAGRVHLNEELVGEFEGTHLRHEFNLTGKIAPGQTVDLEILLYATPEIDGQVGYTSRTRLFKPRFGYYWDWTPRLLNIGIWQDVRLVSRGPARLRNPLTRAVLADDNRTGRVTLIADVEGPASRVDYWLEDDRGERIAHGQAPAAGGRLEHTFDVSGIRPWWPATHGDQPLYTLTLALADEHGRESDRCERRLGFKCVRWLANPGGPSDAQPFVCEINGRPVFLRGVNWVPAAGFYGAIAGERYETLVQLYRHLNANVLRIWGGGILERPEFYDACDRLGLLVWQEFPLSSSGIDNWPPEDPATIETLRRIAEEYIYRRSHHASHLLWCGGNELQGALDGNKVGVGKPVDASHPCIRMFIETVARLDPDKRCLPTSPTGPRFFAAAEDFGKGIHHQTHGPWGNLALSGRYSYFNGDDSLFRSETGAPGCAHLEWIERNKGPLSVWPPRPDNPYWLHSGAWWIPWDDVTREFGPIPDDPAQTAFVVKASRYLQAESLRYAAEAARRRAFGLSGFVIWMGHEAAHCTSNNSILDQPGWPKPAYAWVRKAFSNFHVSLRHESITYKPGERFTGQVWVQRRAGDPPATGRVTARLLSATGQVYEAADLPVTMQGEEVVRAGELDWAVPEAPYGILLVELALAIDGRATRTTYLLSQTSEHPLSPLRSLPTTTLTRLDSKALGRGRREISIQNTGAVAAVGVELCALSPTCALLVDENYQVLLPGETVTIRFELVQTYFFGDSRRSDARLQIEWFNGTSPLTLSRATARSL